MYGVTGKAFYVLDIYDELVEKTGYTLNFYYKTQPFIIKIRSASVGLRSPDPLTREPHWGQNPRPPA